MRGVLLEKENLGASCKGEAGVGSDSCENQTPGGPKKGKDKEEEKSWEREQIIKKRLRVGDSVRRGRTAKTPLGSGGGGFTG